MSMSTHVRGFKPADAKWRKMKAIWDSCEEAGIDPPEEVGKFFDWDQPDEAGVDVNLEEHESCQEWADESRRGFEIDVKKLPKDVTVIRFYNSW